ncbi:MAG: hypothetical protein ETSY2_24195 [Candidatus Entotheonella gemina]|uniref:Uncharacterized protein n=1 Tax=Candidatus Entotheonella gemina TaxID=1429439 RepID=W4M4X3_9BACT|nr:MAG: hypothetical protein ETSY2_24195 [Candidatus Entotheonella gemina]
MGFILPFLVGTVVGGVVTWQVERKRQQGDNGLSVKGWFKRTKDQDSSPDSQSSETESSDAAETADTGSGTSSQTSGSA